MASGPDGGLLGVWCRRGRLASSRGRRLAAGRVRSRRTRGHRLRRTPPSTEGCRRSPGSIAFGRRDRCRGDPGDITRAHTPRPRRGRSRRGRRGGAGRCPTSRAGFDPATEMASRSAGQTTGSRVDPPAPGRAHRCQRTSAECSRDTIHAAAETRSSADARLPAPDPRSWTPRRDRGLRLPGSSPRDRNGRVPLAFRPHRLAARPREAQRAHSPRVARHPRDG